jgi:MFS family permease
LNEFKRGWPALLGAFIGIAAGVSSTFFYSLALFLKPLAAEFGWSRGEASLGALVGTLAAAVAAPATGRLIDRAGSARTAIVSTLVLAAGFAALGYLTGGIASFLAIIAIMSLLNVGSSAMSYSRILIATFDRHRGLALGLALMGSGVGATLIPALLIPYIAAHGWRAGYYCLAIAVLAAILPVACLVLPRRARAPAPDGIAAGASLTISYPQRSVWAEPTFRLLGAIFLLAATAVLGTVVHFVAMLMDAGIEPGRAGRLAGLIGLAVSGARLIAGLLLDRFRAEAVTAILFACSAIGMLVLAAGGTSMAMPGALAIGLGVGAEVDLISYLVSRHFPTAEYGRFYGGVYGLFLLGGALGPALIGFLFDASHTYALPLSVSAGFLVCASLLALRIPRLIGRVSG